MRAYSVSLSVTVNLSLTLSVSDTHAHKDEREFKLLELTKVQCARAYAIKKETIEYIPQDRKARYRKIPIAKKITGCDFAVILDSEKKIYQEIEKTKKKELISKQDKW